MVIVTRADIITEARSWIGTPYHHQASLKGVGCDCLGLLRGIWRELFGTEPELAPPYAPDWAEATGAETLAAAARRHLVEIAIADIMPGDAVLFRWRAGLTAKHAAIVTAPNRFVHAHDGGGRVRSHAAVRVGMAFTASPISCSTFHRS